MNQLYLFPILHINYYFYISNEIINLILIMRLSYPFNPSLFLPTPSKFIKLLLLLCNWKEKKVISTCLILSILISSLPVIVPFYFLIFFFINNINRIFWHVFFFYCNSLYPFNDTHRKCYQTLFVILMYFFIIIISSPKGYLSCITWVVL